jgi:hypothetical protein
MAHPEGSRQILHRLAVGTAADNLNLLEHRQLRLAAELLAGSLGADAPVGGPDLDKLALKLGDAAEHRQDKATMRRGRIGPNIPQAT